MANKRTDGELVELLKLHKKYGTTKTADKVGLGVRTVAEAVASAKGRGLTAETVVNDPLAEARVEVKMLRRSLASLQKKEDTAASIRKEIYNLSQQPVKPPKWLKKADRFSGTPGCPMTNWSDWHFSEVVSLDETGGTNEYNSKIATQRIHRLVERTIRLAKGFAFKEYGKDAKFPGIVVALGGDMISGNIHEELAESNDMHPFQAVQELVKLICAAITKLADEFGRVFVPCVVGNHGRTTQKPRMKGKIFENYEWNLYCQIESYFENDSRVTVHVSLETDVRFTVYNTNFLLTHGDTLGTAGGDGIIGAIGPIMRGILKTMRAYEAINKPVDHVFMGHWHQELWLPLGNVNNSLKGDDEYARLKMRAIHSRPSQNLWFCHDEQGITARMSVFADELQSSRKKPDWITLPATH